MGTLGRTGAGLWCFAVWLALCCAAAAQPDAGALVRQAMEKDVVDWVAMKDYTWQARSVERHFDSLGKVQSQKEQKWDAVVLDGEPHRRVIERDGKPLTAAEDRYEQAKLDEISARLKAETPEQKRKRLADLERDRRKEMAFLLEVPDLFTLKIEGDAVLDGHNVWVVSGAPKPGARPKSSQAAMLLKISGRMWIDKASGQCVKVEAETTGTISWGWILARLNPGAKLLFERMEVNPGVWMPKRLSFGGAGHVGLVKRIAEDQKIDWSNYRKFTVDSRMLPANSN